MGPGEAKLELRVQYRQKIAVDKWMSISTFEKNGGSRAFSNRGICASGGGLFGQRRLRRANNRRNCQDDARAAGISFEGAAEPGASGHCAFAAGLGRWNNADSIAGGADNFGGGQRSRADSTDSNVSAGTGGAWRATVPTAQATRQCLGHGRGGVCQLDAGGSACRTDPEQAAVSVSECED